MSGQEVSKPDSIEEAAQVEEYRSAVLSCAMAARLLNGHDIPALLAAIDRAEAFGPILDPTLFREKSRAMSEDKRLLKAALPLYRMWDAASENANAADDG